MSSDNYVIELKGISKYFGDVVANDNIDLAVKKGEILALLGENGSGKTTLMNMLSGIYKPDNGKIFIEGQEVTIQSPEDAKHFGIGMVHQHFKLVDKFSAADNIWIGTEGGSPWLTKQRNEKIGKISKQFGFEVNPEKMIYDMSVSEKQTVEILKVLYYGADILILDEPTAVLTLQETRKLFAVLRQMKKQGCAIIIITHKLNEVLEISDRVTILRKGQSVATVNTKETNAQELTDLMVGKSVSLEIERPVVEKQELLLDVKNLSVIRDDTSVALDNVSFELYGGEILGVAGVSGCGQKELCESIAGLVPVSQGSSILYKGEEIAGTSPRSIIKKGISMSFIPEDRLGMGLAASLGITDNMMLKSYVDNKGPFVNRRAAKKLADKVVEELEVVTPGTETPVRRLSGGNVQKVLLGREISAKPNVIITAYPVRGLDINSSYMIYDILNQQKKDGVGVLFVGEDLDVMLELCDRIVVLCHGKVTGIVDAKETSKEELGLLMTDAGSVREKEESPEAMGADENSFRYIPEATEENKKEFKLPKAKTPFVRIAKKADISLWKAVGLYAISILVALVLGGLFIWAIGQNPFEYYREVLKGCFDFQNAKPIYFRGFLRVLIPLLTTSLGIAVAFKMKFWNIGANGQFMMGAISATTVAFLLGDVLPQWAMLLVMLAAGIFGGGLLGLLVAFFKVKFNASETLLTLMFNYILLYFTAFLKNLMFYRTVSETGQVFRPEFKTLPENAWLYTVDLGNVTVDISLFVSIGLAVFLFFYLKNTKQGYEIAVVGDSPNTAKYAGMNVKKIILRTAFISAAIAGAAGMMEVAGSATSHTLSENITSDVGFTGITVAYIAKLNPLGIVIASVGMAILQKGAAIAESTFNISSSASSILQGIILFTVLAADFFSRYKFVFNFGKKEVSK